MIYDILVKSRLLQMFNASSVEYLVLYGTTLCRIKLFDTVPVADALTSHLLWNRHKIILVS